MRTLFVLSLLMCAITAGAAAAPSGIRPDHPALGRWTWDYKGCTEIYELRADATSSASSGEEVADSTFTISDEAEPSGFYRVVDTITGSNGKTGCDGRAGGTPVGDVSERFIFIRPSGNEMLICRDESVNLCMGPLRRP